MSKSTHFNLKHNSVSSRSFILKVLAGKCFHVSDVTGGLCGHVSYQNNVTSVFYTMYGNNETSVRCGVSVNRNRKPPNETLLAYNE